MIYLHDVRGFSLGTAGLVIAVSSVGQLTAGVLVGPLIDRFGSRLTLGCGLVLQAVGFGLMPFIDAPWQAFVLIGLEGVGAAGFWPSQSTLISRLTPAAQRHTAFAQQRLTMNLGVGIGGIVGGFIAHVSTPATFTVLFLLDAITFLAYIVVLFFIHDPRGRGARGRFASVVPRGAAPQDLPRALVAQLPLRDGRLLAAHAPAPVRARPRAHQPSARSGSCSRSTRA